jgi:potassium-transporting ATPase potassium-binding subunit
MNTEILGILAIFILTLVVAWPLGHYIARVYSGERTWTDPIFGPVERLFFRLSGIDPAREMSWQDHLKALLTINLIWFLMSMFVLMNMAWLPLNPDGNPSMSPDLAFNTAISFVVNCNLQHYSGESGLSYLGQIWLMFLQFVSAATGLAAAAALFNALRIRTEAAPFQGPGVGSGVDLGNFYDYFLKSSTRILLPLSILVTIILLLNGSPMTFEGKDTIIGLQGDTVQVSRGPVAAFVAIKHIGTNGGGFFGKPKLSDGFAGAICPIYYPGCDDFCLWFLPASPEIGTDDFWSDDDWVFDAGHSEYHF